MTSRLLATTALLLLVSSGALAQGATSALMANGYQLKATDALASKVIGIGVYSTIATNGSSDATAPAVTTTTPAANAMNSGNAVTATGTDANAAAATNKAVPGAVATAANANGAPAANADDTNAQQIGKIGDLVVGTDGKVEAAIVSIGGFLGIGQKNVAVDYTQLHWAVAQDGSMRATLDTTADALKAAPDFQFPANGQASNASAGSTPANTTAAVNTASANGNVQPAADVDVTTLKPTNVSALKSDDLKGADVIDRQGNKIASIDDFVLTQDGKIDAVIVDFGGFLGIGSKQIALAMEGLKFMDDPNGKHFLAVNLTKDQLKAQRAYNSADYAANRAAERLSVSP